MKTYFLDVIKRIKRFSEEFNVQTTLCDKTWTVFNDTGEREVYIFQPDGTVFITSNGIGIKGKWHWLSANRSLIINKDDNVMMFHPEFIDNTILALTLDGTSKMAFLIEQGNKNAFAAKTLAQLEDYFIIKEKKLIEDEKQRREEEERRKEEEKRRKEEEKRRKEEEKRRKEEEQHEKWLKQNEKRLEKEAEKVYNNLMPKWIAFILNYDLIVFLGFVFILGGPFILKRLGYEFDDGYFFIALIIFYFVYLVIFFCVTLVLGFNKNVRRQIEKNFLEWQKNNPNDDRTPFVKKLVYE